MFSLPSRGKPEPQQLTRYSPALDIIRNATATYNASRPSVALARPGRIKRGRATQGGIGIIGVAVGVPVMPRKSLRRASARVLSRSQVLKRGGPGGCILAPPGSYARTEIIKCATTYSALIFRGFVRQKRKKHLTIAEKSCILDLIQRIRGDKKMNKKTKSITVRFTENDYKYLKAIAKMAGQNVSGYIRMLSNMSITAVKVKMQIGELKHEDFQALLND